MTANLKISGAITITKTQFHNKNFFFFGDIHKSWTGLCPDPCTSMKDQNIINDCVMVDKLLAWIFESYQNYKIDFYLEFPYIPVLLSSPNRQKFQRRDMLSQMRLEFENCFYRETCSYTNVHFHSIDVRLGNIENKYLIVLQGIYNLYDQFVKIFQIAVGNQDQQPDDRILNIMKIYDWVSTDNNLHQIFDVYLKSDDYVTEMKILFQPLFSELQGRPKLIQYLEKILFQPKSIVFRRNKSMSRIRAQIEALVEQGDSVLADKITGYISRKFKEKFGYFKADGWRALMAYYHQYLNLSIHDRDYLSIKQGIINFLNQHPTDLSYVPIEALLMDAYTLARMFRLYPDWPSQLSIVYAGVAHIQIYLDFFESELGCVIINFDDSYKFWLTKYQRSLPFNPNMVNRCLSLSRGWFEI